MVQDTDVSLMLGGVFSWHISWTLLSIKYSLNAAIRLDIVVDNVTQFLATLSPSTGGHFQQEYEPFRTIVGKRDSKS